MIAGTEQTRGGGWGRLARDPDYRRLWAGEVVSSIGSQVTTIAMPLLVLALTGSATKAGLAGVARTLALLLGILILRRHGAPPAEIGLAFALVSGGILAGSLASGRLRRRVPARWAVLVEPWSYVLFVPLLLIAHTPLAVGLVIGAMLLPIPLSDSVIVARWMAMAPEELRSRVTASTGLLASVLAWLGPLAAGALVQYTGIETTVLAIAAWSGAIALGATLSRAFRNPG
ncbi:MAG TPA: hypothetical protein VL977_01025 [Solirubrobacteraceae bacterium]|nr:hypothetical protein [Solirubrobacteraceae bacterium]